MSLLDCPVKSLCGGCDWGHLEYQTQLDNKKQNFLELLKEHQLSFDEAQIEVLSLRPTGLRSRFDLAMDSHHLGLYQKNVFPKKIVPIDDCPQLENNLRLWFQEYAHNFKLPLKKGSLRLRVSSVNQQKGIWLDLANEDIKTLLTEAHFLRQLMKVALVEVGQKRKQVVETSDGLKLKESLPSHWFQTIYNDQKISLNSWISSFTQPSQEMNFVIAEKIKALLKPFGFRNGFEFGAGIGNLSFPLLSQCEKLTVTEIDAQALRAFEKTLTENDLTDKVTIHCGDFQRERELDLSKFDFIFVNPPRSGLKSLCKNIAEAKVKNLFYMSCYPESFCKDIQEISKFTKCNIKNISIIDQFTQTHHYEILCHIEIQGTDSLQTNLK